MQKNMKKIITTILLAVVMASLPMLSWAVDEPKTVEQKQEEDKVTGEVAASVFSAYIWRGQELTRHSAVIQPSITASYKGFTANVWGNLDTRPYGAADQKYSSNFTETDVTLSYSRKFGIVQAGAGYIYYSLAAPAPGGADLPDSQEIFVSLGLDTILTPTLTVYKEIDHYRQWYATFGISHTFALHEKAGLKLAATASYLLSTDETTYAKYDSDSLATADKFNNFHDGTATISLPLTVYKSLTVTPAVSYVFPLSDDARYEMKARGLQGTANPSDRDSAYLYGGVTLSFTF
ncbi:MAG: hypothetical protein CVU55_08245 [Deltaproteobacteria bacterium HGW-Deltaproteobacteria-13]|jgi:hypothetical protein|nr:MAG: hypothetical protein CVU55_08245 [Deltaproteobacteria bacterium HGW-Deltaproteobacteria-13]